MRDDASSHDASSLSHTTRRTQKRGRGRGRGREGEDGGRVAVATRLSSLSRVRLSLVYLVSRSLGVGVVLGARVRCPRERARKQFKDQMANKWRQLELVQDWVDFR